MRGSDVDEAVLEGVLDELGAARAAQLLLDVRAVGLDGPHGQVELAGDLGVGVTERDAAQHAAGDATRVHITLSEHDDSLCFDVRDDGTRFDADVGLTNIRDRVAAVGGRVTVEATPGRGTRISAAIPLAPPTRQTAKADFVERVAPR